MANTIGLDVDQNLQYANDTATLGGDLAESSSEVESMTATANEQIGEVVVTLRTAYQELQADLDELVNTHLSRLQGMDGWVGGSNQTVEQHMTDITAAKNAFSESSLGELEAFETSLRGGLEDFRTTLTSGYSKVTTEIQESMQSQADATTKVTESIAEIDRSIT